jgi:hypothetical protein
MSIKGTINTLWTSRTYSYDASVSNQLIMRPYELDLAPGKRILDVQYFVSISSATDMTGATLGITGIYESATPGTTQRLGVPQRWTVRSGTMTAVNLNTAAATLVGTAVNTAGVILGSGTSYSAIGTNTSPLVKGAALRLNNNAGTCTVTVHCKVRYDTLDYCVDVAPQAAVSSNQTGTVYLRTPASTGPNLGSSYEYVEYLVLVAGVTGTPNLTLTVESSYVNPADETTVVTPIPVHVDTLAAHGGSLVNLNTASATAVVNGSALTTGAITGIATNGGIMRIRVEKPLGQLLLKLSGGTAENSALLHIWTTSWKAV